MRANIVDKETGEFYGTVSTKYKNVGTLFANAVKWCKRHGFVDAGLDVENGKITTLYVVKK